MLLARILLAVTAAACPLADLGAQNREARAALEAAVRRYLCPDDPPPDALRDAARLARGHEDLLAEVVRTKSYLEPAEAIASLGAIDDRFRFVPRPNSAASRGTNDALFYGPASTPTLAPLAVYVPDAVSTTGFRGELAREGAARGWFVFLVPDERQDNRYDPTPREHRRHLGPLRDLLLRHPIDPDRVGMVGSGRGGHVTWDVGLLGADRFVALVPCNGGLITEGGYKASGGVFLENGRRLEIFSTFNTSFDHGIESCRYAAKKLTEWGCRIVSVEEPQMRTMGLAEATEKVVALRRDAHPREIAKRFNHLEDGEHFWLRALDRKPREWDPTAALKSKTPLPAERDKRNEAVWALVRQECALLGGKVAPGNRIDVATHGIGRVRVYFDPDLVDFTGKVTVVINGKASAARPLTRQAEVMLEHVRETGDTARLYWDAADHTVPDLK